MVHHRQHATLLTTASAQKLEQIVRELKDLVPPPAAGQPLPKLLDRLRQAIDQLERLQLQLRDAADHDPGRWDLDFL